MEVMGNSRGDVQQDKTWSREVMVCFFGKLAGGWVPLPCHGLQGWGGQQTASCCLPSYLFPFLQTTSALFGFCVCVWGGGGFSLCFFSVS